MKAQAAFCTCLPGDRRNDIPRYDDGLLQRRVTTGTLSFTSSVSLYECRCHYGYSRRLLLLAKTAPPRALTPSSGAARCCRRRHASTKLSSGRLAGTRVIPKRKPNPVLLRSPATVLHQRPHRKSRRQRVQLLPANTSQNATLPHGRTQGAPPGSDGSAAPRLCSRDDTHRPSLSYPVRCFRPWAASRMASPESGRCPSTTS